MSKLPFAPSVGMHEVPGESVSEHLGFAPHKQEVHDDSDELDGKLGRKLRLSHSMHIN